jgi:hypothetical protein
MANGVKFGRKRKLSDYQRAEAIKRRGAGETLASIATERTISMHRVQWSNLAPRQTAGPFSWRLFAER